MLKTARGDSLVLLFLRGGDQVVDLREFCDLTDDEEGRMICK